MYRTNTTLFLHVIIMTPNPDHPNFRPGLPFAHQPLVVFKNSQTLVKHMKQIKDADMMNLMDSMGDMPAPKAKEDENADHTFYPHWKHEIYINLVYD